MENKTTDQKIISMTLNKFFAMIFAIVVGTNTVSLTIQRVGNNSEQINYDREANKRRIEHAKKELQYEYKIKQLEKENKKCNSK